MGRITLLLLALSALAPVLAGGQWQVGRSYYFEDFDAGGVPWRAGESRNVEEVFKNYLYYELVFGDGGDALEVREHRRGQPVRRTAYRVREDGSLAPLAEAVAPPSGAALYAEHCASCHGAQRLGLSGPALLPESLARLKREEAARVIGEGRVATQMPGFKGALSGPQTQALLYYIYSAPDDPVTWDEARIRASRVIAHPPGSLPDQPVFRADPLNLFLVVESGDHHLSVLDGDRMEPIHRAPTRPGLHGGPKYSPDGRYVYLASRGGWVSKFDLYNLKTVAEIRAAINTRNLAISGDGRYLLVGNYLPRTLVLLDAADLSLLRVIPVTGVRGTASRVSAVYQAAPRNSFIVALKDVPEVWEIPYTGEGALAPRRIAVDDVLDDFFFDPGYRHLIGAARRSRQGQVLNLDTGRVVAALDLPGMPHLGSGITWQYQGRPVMATPDLKEGVVTVIAMDDWSVIKRIATQGPGFFMRSHENTPYAWVDVFFGPHKDVLHVIDKRTLEIVRTLRPAPGKTAAHVEFDRYGKLALVSLWEMDGAVVVYDAASLAELKRLPMVKPSGKYNAFNKITLSSGTSH